MNIGIYQKASNYPAVLNMVRSPDVSNRYEMVRTMDVIEMLDKEGWYPERMSQTRSRMQTDKRFSKHMVRFENPSLPEIGNGLRLETIIVNAHNGVSSLKIMAGIWRLICINGMQVCDSLLHSFKIRHRRDANYLVKSALEHFVESMPRIGARINEYKQIEMPYDDQIWFANAALKIKYDDEFLNTHRLSTTELLYARRKEDEDNCLWNVFNRIQEKLLNGGTRVQKLNGGLAVRYREDGTAVPTKRMRMKKITNIDEDCYLNRSLWAVTELYAKSRNSVLTFDDYIGIEQRWIN